MQPRGEGSPPRCVVAASRVTGVGCGVQARREGARWPQEPDLTAAAEKRGFRARGASTTGSWPAVAVTLAAGAGRKLAWPLRRWSVPVSVVLRRKEQSTPGRGPLRFPWRCCRRPVARGRVRRWEDSATLPGPPAQRGPCVWLSHAHPLPLSVSQQPAQSFSAA